MYPAPEPTPDTLLADFRTLLNLYDTLFARLGPSIVDNLSPPAEDEFQESASILSAKKKSRRKYKEPPPGAVPLPPQPGRTAGSGYARDPSVTAEALSKSGYRCEWDAGHLSFVSRVTRENFVEAHHLVPMQFQNEFGARLDVVETLLSRARRVAACFITGVQRNLKAGSRFNTYSASRFLSWGAAR